MAAAAPSILPVCADANVAMARRMGNESCILVKYLLGMGFLCFFGASLGVSFGVSFGKK